MQEMIDTIRAAFTASFERCPNYQGLKADELDEQCTHPDNKTAGSWCRVDCCPLLRDD